MLQTSSRQPPEAWPRASTEPRTVTTTMTTGMTGMTVTTTMIVMTGMIATTAMIVTMMTGSIGTEPENGNTEMDRDGFKNHLCFLFMGLCGYEGRAKG